MSAQTMLPRSWHKRTLVEPAVLWGRRRAIRSLVQPEPPRVVPVADLGGRVVVKVADSRQEWLEAFRLVTTNYQGRGYDLAGEGEFRFTSYHALPDTAVFVAKEGPRVIGTMSLVADNRLLGLPLESLYRNEVQELRRQGRRLGEPSSLAMEHLGLREFTVVFQALCRLMFQYHARHGGDTWVITVNPRHRAHYTRFFGFAPLGPRRAYTQVQGHPAEAYYVDQALMQARAPETHADMFGERLPASVLKARPLPAELARYLASRSTQTNRAFVEELLQCEPQRRW